MVGSEGWNASRAIVDFVDHLAGALLNTKSDEQN